MYSSSLLDLHLYNYPPPSNPNSTFTITRAHNLQNQEKPTTPSSIPKRRNLQDPSDMHYANGAMSRCRDVLPSEFELCSDLNTTMFVRRLIHAEKPDFIAFTGGVSALLCLLGDNIFGSSTADAAESLIRAFGPAMESKLPWAAVLGNHDQESTMTREELMSFISLMDYSVSQINPCDMNKGSVKSHIDGFGNYNLRVHGAFNSDLVNTSVLNLFFLDSGDRATVGGVRTYGWIKESQLGWLRTISKELQVSDQNLDPSVLSGKVVAPALTFFHIPIPEVRLLWFKEFVGQFYEGVACSSFNSGVLETLASIGDVKAVFIGHDHNNDFCGEISSIWFCYGGGSGYHGYGRAGWLRRARVITTELQKGNNMWMGVRKIRTWKRLDDDDLSKIDEQVLWEFA
ncbi:hypothetical protein GIB67_034738 [Kingdonia uniflora]|uniref:Calcineurin-like phosphoesterase domain-containing protein n=1 Tax=Kingdonia uniflora TaxID=39325 RepID=A0A7J7ML81_9MAGN|nr:hypothetical protein GIB67_034738 [Kingdonia uniflora]